VTDSEILTAIKEVAALEGILLCPEGAATIPALVELVRRGVIDGDTSLVVFNTGSGLKYPEVLAQIGL
jgi:threonine synthase